MQKPIKPIEPRCSGYLEPKTKEGINMFGNPVALPNEQYVRDYHKYQDDMEQYHKDIVLYKQVKFIEDIQRSTLKLCLKKYYITKNK